MYRIVYTVDKVQAVWVTDDDISEKEARRNFRSWAKSVYPLSKIKILYLTFVIKN